MIAAVIAIPIVVTFPFAVTRPLLMPVVVMAVVTRSVVPHRRGVVPDGWAVITGRFYDDRRWKADTNSDVQVTRVRRRCDARSGDAAANNR
jgi:hypothetical protein